jgi:hypothetical protein
MAGAIPIVPMVYRINPQLVEFDYIKRGLRKEVGRGVSASVYSGWYSGEKVAIKILGAPGPGSTLSQVDLDTFWKQAELQYALRHDHIVPVHGAYVDDLEGPPEYGVVMQWMPHNLHWLIYEAAVPPGLGKRVQLCLQVSMPG